VLGVLRVLFGVGDGDEGDRDNFMIKSNEW